MQGEAAFQVFPREPEQSAVNTVRKKTGLADSGQYGLGGKRNFNGRSERAIRLSLAGADLKFPDPVQTLIRISPELRLRVLCSVHTISPVGHFDIAASRFAMSPAKSILKTDIVVTILISQVFYPPPLRVVNTQNLPNI